MSHAAQSRHAPSLTRLECHLFGVRTKEGDTFSSVAVSPCRLPGTMVFAGAAAARHSLGGQVAFKLGLEHFIEAGLEFFENKRGAHASDLPDRANPEDPSEETLQMLEDAFRRANNSVYQFGHRLAAGGRLAASLLGIVVEKNFVAAGRVGDGSAYLYRKGELFPFFEPPKDDDQFIGSNSVVSVELASVALEEHDRVLVFSTALNADEELKLVADLYTMKHASEVRARIGVLFPDLKWGVLAQIGPQTIYLDEVAP